MPTHRRQAILVVTDTQGANVIGCGGRPELQTPNLGRLAARGIRFERAYATCPHCTHARSAILAATYVHTNGVWGNALPLGSDLFTVEPRLKAGACTTRC